jgi:hypothetical protein
MQIPCRPLAYQKICHLGGPAATGGKEIAGPPVCLNPDDAMLLAFHMSPVRCKLDTLTLLKHQGRNEPE